MKNLLAILFLSALLVGCAGRELKVENLNSSEFKKGVNLLIEPYESLGLKVTPEIRSGRIQVKKGIFPSILFGEYFPGRIQFYHQFIYIQPLKETAFIYRTAYFENFT